MPVPIKGHYQNFCICLELMHFKARPVLHQEESLQFNKIIYLAPWTDFLEWGKLVDRKSNHYSILVITVMLFIRVVVKSILEPSSDVIWRCNVTLTFLVIVTYHCDYNQTSPKIRGILVVPEYMCRFTKRRLWGRVPAVPWCCLKLPSLLPLLSYQRPQCVVPCLWDMAHTRTLAILRKE